MPHARPPRQHEAYFLSAPPQSQESITTQPSQRLTTCLRKRSEESAPFMRTKEKSSTTLQSLRAQTPCIAQ